MRPGLEAHVLDVVLRVHWSSEGMALLMPIRLSLCTAMSNTALDCRTRTAPYTTSTDARISDASSLWWTHEGYHPAGCGEHQLSSFSCLQCLVAYLVHFGFDFCH